MDRTRTLPEALEAAATRGGGFTFREERGRERVRPYAEVLSASLTIAGALRDRGLSRGDRVAIIVPDPEPFLLSFLGTSVGGFVPVPLYPPLEIRKLTAYLEHARRIFAAAAPALVITTPAIRRLLGTLRASVPSLRAIVAVEELEGPALAGIERPSLDDPCFVQFTSGSTSAPKGVVLTHGNLGANIDAFGGPDGIAATREDVGVSWLPLFHDMGLIGMAIGSIFHEVSTVVMPPLLFLRRPSEWLRAISEHEGSISFAPNFAYAYCVRRVRDHDLEGVDLSSWRIAGCGAEPIQSSTLRAFAERFAAHGFRETAFLPCYGMAEHTLAVTFPKPGARLAVDTVHGPALAERGEAVPCDAARAGAMSFVCCGKPFPKHDIRIVDASGRALGDRLVGEIVARGPSVMRGYEAQPKLTADALEDGWLHTGDLGYSVDGSLFVCGRKKDMIVVAGKNYYPQDLEWAVSDVDGVRRGSVIAFGTSPFAGTREEVVVVAETKATATEEELTRRIRQAVLAAVGLRVDEVVVVPAGTLPKTSSGKPQRARTKARYEEGTLLRRPDGRVTLLSRLVASQWGYLKVALRQRMARGRGASPAA
jgi:fatty-acyl-CoA synthase